MWGQQLEHRSVTAKLVSLLLAWTTQLNLIDEMYIGFAFEFLSLFLIWNMLTIGLEDRRPALIPPLTMVASLLLFWPVSYEIWTFGIASFQYFFAVFCAVLTVWALTRWPGRWKGVAIASIATVAAIFTTAHGFALIPVGALGILASGTAVRRTRWLQACSFVITGALCTIAYLQGYIPPVHRPPNELTHVTWLHLVRYLFTYVGSPFWTEIRLSRFFGLVGIGLLCAVAYYLIRSMQDWIRAATPWLLLACYTLGCAAITTHARIRFGVYQASSSRYCSVVIPFWISLIVVSSMVVVHLRPRLRRTASNAALAATVVVFIVGYSLLYYRGLHILQDRSALILDGLPYVVHYDTAPDDKLRVFHPIPQRVRTVAPSLEQFHLSCFAHRP